MKTRLKALLRTLSVSLALVAVPALGSGCSPAWVVVKQAAPNPFNAASEFSIEPISYDGLRVGEKTEADYLADKEPAKQEAWRSDLVQVNQSFQEALLKDTTGLKIAAGPAAAPGPFVIKPHVTWAEPGLYAAVYNKPSAMDLSVQIADAQGAIVDEFKAHVVVPIQSVMNVPTNPSVTDRFKECGQKLGSIAARYLKTRTAPAK
ncbi:MAG: hypothetical protein U1A78_34720 [Polyangia bacterium]